MDALAPKPKGRPRKMPMPIPPKPVKPAKPLADDARTREDLLAELEYLRAENAYLKSSMP